MMDPLDLTIRLVKGISGMVAGAKTNYHSCEVLRDQAEYTLEILEELRGEMPFDPAANKALKLVNKALEKAYLATEDCCNTAFFFVLFRHRAHCDALREASTELECALNRTCLVTLTKSCQMQERLLSMTERQHRQKFDDIARRAHRSHSLKNLVQSTLCQVGLVHKQYLKELNHDL